jgi:NitT/TauT family transport system substrate-binding protein
MAIARLARLVGLLLGISLGTSACSHGVEHRLSIAMNDWTGYQPLVYASELGILDRRQVHLATLGSTTESLQQFRAGTVDAVTVTLDEALLLLAEGYDIGLVLLMDVSNGADAIVSQPGIRQLKQLKGKRIGVENTAVGAYVLARAMEQAGLSLKDITTLPMTAHEQVRFFQTQRIDAVVTFEPMKSQLLRDGGQVVFDSSMIPGEIVDVLVVKRECLEKNAAQIQHVIDAWFRTLDHIKQHRDESVQWFARSQKLNLETTGHMLSEIHFPDRNENRQRLGADGSIHHSVGKLRDIMLQHELLPRQPDTSRFIYNKFVN